MLKAVVKASHKMERERVQRIFLTLLESISKRIELCWSTNQGKQSLVLNQF